MCICGDGVWVDGGVLVGNLGIYVEMYHDMSVDTIMTRKGGELVDVFSVGTCLPVFHSSYTAA